MKVSQLFDNIEYKAIGDVDDVEIINIACDTKEVGEGTCYFCLQGSNVDGHSLADIAASNGARLLVVNRPIDIDVPQVVVSDSRAVMAIVAGNYYGNPREKFKLIGVTGTNGKTTTTKMIESILTTEGYKVGVIGTLGIKIGNINLPNKLTTPDPIELHRIFKHMAQIGVDVVVMEVSAHAIELQKMAGIKCDIGVLTNVTQDHLDFFGDMERYASVKRKFLGSEYCSIGIVNIDDEVGKSIALDKNVDIPLYTFGLNNPSDVFCPEYTFGANGTSYLVNVMDELVQVDTKLIGKFNLYNAMASIVVSKLLGVSMDNIRCGLNTMEPVEGRCNVLNLSNGVTVIIDYAHTPDGLRNILTAIRPLVKGRMISVFGCGGNRDRAKRPIMGKISGECADYTIITSDNPRLEDPSEIIRNIESGIQLVTEEYMCIVDRCESIRYAISIASENDVIVLSGKGAEKYMDIGGVKYEYNDRDTVLEEYDNLSKINEVNK
ncbi:MAG: UDP-N-acetylmuramoyl-L-alanyl-D-glutamate--2,6-diaminopimelate ligase [Clostridia bacterium]|nr:UDP-N-acetylmuramoyl-L-alanyl-D-glutamate--2,6-diaminopimelate ligase [Clostridia bacterium]